MVSGTNSFGDRQTSNAYKTSYRGADVALKVFSASDHSVTKNIMFKETVDNWRGLQSHPYILPLFDLSDSDGLSTFTVMSPWQENGNVIHYLHNCSNVDRLGLLIQLADVMAFLHSRHIVHGNLYPENILISNSRSILLDFTLENDPGLDLDHIRYIPPEHLIPNAIPSLGYDCYSFASTCFEILTGRPPFADHLSPADVVLALYANEPPFNRPSKLVLTSSLDDMLWSLLTHCWNPNPDSRPRMSDVHQTLQKLHIEVLNAPAKARL